MLAIALTIVQMVLKYHLPRKKEERMPSTRIPYSGTQRGQPRSHHASAVNPVALLIFK